MSQIKRHFELKNRVLDRKSTLKIIEESPDDFDIIKSTYLHDSQ